MTRLVLLTAALGTTMFAWNPGEEPNVNSRYTVESVHITGKRTARISQNTRREVESVVGQRLDHGILEQIASRIRKELRVDGVAVHVAKGSKPEQVTVEFTVEGSRRRDFDIDATKGSYHSRQGWSGGVNVQTAFGNNDVGIGMLSDGDSEVERFSGIRARYERNSLGTDRLRFRVELDSYHEQWNSSTMAALPGSHFSPDLYRSRLEVQPSLTLVIAEPLTLTVGVSAGRLEPQGNRPAESVNGPASALRLHEQWESRGIHQGLDAEYALRAGTGLLGSDFAYTRQSWTVGYRLAHGHSAVAVDFLAGRITGTAPMYERFVLGNGSTLRGWNKYDLDPLGGSRVAHGSVGYSYRAFQVFYDTGAVWDGGGGDAGAKHSVGAGFGHAGKDGFLLAMAFPLRSGHIDPMFIAGFNF